MWQNSRFEMQADRAATPPDEWRAHGCKRLNLALLDWIPA